jgi:integrase
MSLKKLGPAKWWVKASIRDKRKGYPISKQITVTGSRAEAVLAEAELLATLRASSLKTTHISTFGDAIEIYRVRLRAMGKGSKCHLASIARIERELGHVSLDELPDRLEAYIKVVNNSPTWYGKPHKGSAARTFVAIASAVFNLLAETEAIDRNPITKRRFPIKKVKARDRYLTPEERLRLFATIQSTCPELLPLISFLIVVPCRVSEFTTARKEQYSPISNTIYIPDSKADIPMYKPVPEELRGYFNSIPADCPWLFYYLTSHGKYYPWRDFRRTWITVLDKAGITDFHVHDLRHISATDLLTAGNPERMIMDIAGWKTPMLSTYYHKNSFGSAQNIKFGEASLQSHYKACYSM